MLTNKSYQFRKLVLLSTILVYLVILAGGIVRSTGSGMGCPDWPKCFGQWVPPTNISELPTNYKQKFKVGIHYIADFNAFKTWIEYTNRLLGVLVGLSVFLMCLYSLKLYNIASLFFCLSVTIVLLTGFQGWIGAKVVATNLSKYMITVHMLIAILILSLLLFLLHKTNVSSNIVKTYFIGFDKLLLLLSICTFIQILIGTQVRQQIDTIAVSYQDRALWIDQLGSIFSFHRAIAVFVLLLNSVLAYFFVRRNGFVPMVSKIVISFVVLLLLEYGLGILMVWFAIPAFTQPFHLFLATLVFGLQFYAWLSVKYSNNILVGSSDLATTTR